MFINLIILNRGKYWDEVRGEKNAHTAGHVYFTVPDIRTIDLIIRTKGNYTEDNDDNEMMT